MVLGWLDTNAPILSASDTISVNLEAEGFATRLYHACLQVLRYACHEGRSDDHDGSHSFKMKEVLGRLYLWGANFRSGDLDAALDPFEDLRSNVLELLGDIGRLLLRGMAQTTQVHRQLKSWKSIQLRR